MSQSPVFHLDKGNWYNKDECPEHQTRYTKTKDIIEPHVTVDVSFFDVINKITSLEPIGIVQEYWGICELNTIVNYCLFEA